MLKNELKLSFASPVTILLRSHLAFDVVRAEHWLLELDLMEKMHTKARRSVENDMIWSPGSLQIRLVLVHIIRKDIFTAR